MPLAIQLLCHPLAANDPILRGDSLSLSKLGEEGTMSEVLMILGWLFNFCLLQMAHQKINIWHGAQTFPSF
jgi:hypothetical protein